MSDKNVEQLVQLESSVLRVTLDPGYGARVVSLVDRRTGRDWLVPDDRARRNPHAPIYDADAARGWDECFPTVAVTDNGAWPSPMRDHGELWGRPTDTLVQDTAIESLWRAERFALTRTLRIDGAMLTAEYVLRNISPEAFPYLYSQHLLLALRPGETIAIEGIRSFSDIDTGARLEWPVEGLATVQGVEAGLMRKLYAPVEARVRTRVSGGLGSFEISWSRQDMPAYGLWIDYGGWPQTGRGVHQVAFEPTSACAHGLVDADAPVLPAGDERRWQISISLSP
jgi:hypothetical protein